MYHTFVICDTDAVCSKNKKNFKTNGPCYQIVFKEYLKVSYCKDRNVVKANTENKPPEFMSPFLVE